MLHTAALLAENEKVLPRRGEDNPSVLSIRKFVLFLLASKTVLSRVLLIFHTQTTVFLNCSELQSIVTIFPGQKLIRFVNNIEPKSMPPPWSDVGCHLVVHRSREHPKRGDYFQFLFAIRIKKWTAPVRNVHPFVWRYVVGRTVLYLQMKRKRESFSIFEIWVVFPAVIIGCKRGRSK